MKIFQLARGHAGAIVERMQRIAHFSFFSILNLLDDNTTVQP